MAHSLKSLLDLDGDQTLLRGGVELAASRPDGPRAGAELLSGAVVVEAPAQSAVPTPFCTFLYIANINMYNDVST